MNADFVKAKADLDEIRPKQHQRIYDLVSDAGIDVSDWSNIKGGISKAASNPKYCYEWAFVEPGKVVLLNLWYSSMSIKGNSIIHHLNAREFANSLKNMPYKSAVVRRANSVDHAIQTAISDRLPVRVIICDGSRRYPDDSTSDASRVDKRLLDSEVWAVTAYDWNTGACLLERGGTSLAYADQFEAYEPIELESQRATMSASRYSRDPAVRKRCLLRAAGHCEWCGEEGFHTRDGRVYLETHHIKPLADGGKDGELNVAVLCANHHREAHFGLDCEKMASELRAIVLKKY